MSQNKLANESSPYLLQHSSNPVEWYPWSDEAFEKAAREQKTVFLSIGYSSCHWCHVMKDEVFENKEAADFLNKHFVSVKVDREERPDIDQIYMEACVAIKGSGGWPLNVFMTPDKKPFYAATYIPLEIFLNLTGNIVQIWDNDREKIFYLSDEISNKLNRESRREIWDDSLIHEAYEILKDSFDRENGGFGGAPKFPCAHNLMFLQRYGICYKNDKAIEMARKTLEKMIKSGLFDQIGGGFFRYSTDEKYVIPHFEKMLYDNAMMIIVCSEFSYIDAARRTIDFCTREMEDVNGAFYTSEDADSEREEGKFYLFEKAEICDILGDDADRFCKLCGVTEKGNFEGKNHLNLLEHEEYSRDDAEFISLCGKKLFEYREKRTRPFRDEKILLSSNGLMLAALSTFARLYEDREILVKAEKLAEFLTEKMQKDGRYFSVYKEELGPHYATSDDYAYLAWGLLRLHQATLDGRWLEKCMDVSERMIELFSDENGLLMLSGTDVKDLPFKSANTYDGALPSGNSIAAGVFERLYRLSGNKMYKDAHDKIRDALAYEAKRYPASYTSLMSSVMLERRGIKVSLPDEMEWISKKYYPFATFCSHDGSKSALVCDASSCMPPIDDSEKVLYLLEKE